MKYREWYIEDNIAYEPGTDGVDEEKAIHVVEARVLTELNSLEERLEIAEKHIAMSGEVAWDSYIEEIRAY